MYHAIAICIILFFEYIGDYLLQSREIATNKSSKLGSLRIHLYSIWFASWIGMILVGRFILHNEDPNLLAIKFATINTLVHGIVDWNIWRIFKRLVIRRFTKGTGLFNRKGFLINADINQYMRTYQTNKLYAEDKLFYDFIGLDRLLHVCTIVVVYFYLVG